MKLTILVCVALTSLIGGAMADDLKLVAVSNGHGGTTFLYRRDKPTLTVFAPHQRGTHQRMEYNSHGQIIGERTVAD